MRASLNGIIRIGLASIVLLSVTAYAHNGHIHEAPWHACEAKQLSNACAYKNGEGDLFKGSCQSFSGSLMCVRNQPIIKAGSTIESSCSLLGWVLPKVLCKSANSK